MAKTPAERQKAYRERRGSNANESRINAVVSVTAVTELGRLAKRYAVTKREMLERLIMQGVVEKFNGAEKARELLKEHGGDREAAEGEFCAADKARELWEEYGGNTWDATGAFREELKREFPGFKTNSELPEHAEALRRYTNVTSALGREKKAREQEG